MLRERKLKRSTNRIKKLIFKTDSKRKYWLAARVLLTCDSDFGGFSGSLVGRLLYAFRDQLKLLCFPNHRIEICSFLTRSGRSEVRNCLFHCTVANT